jgi:hypothetical protein
MRKIENQIRQMNPKILKKAGPFSRLKDFLLCFSVFALWLFMISPLGAQTLDWMGQTAMVPTADKGAVEWKNQFTFYGDNNEFFEPFRVRETTLGQQFESFLDGSIKETTDFWAGVFVDHRSAQAVTVNAEPILSFIYHGGGSQFVLGTLLPVYRHGLIEPMEDTTLELTRPIEYGLEFIQKDNFVNLDSFLNWQQILTDVDREIFDYGGSARLPIWSDFTLLGQLHGYHVGGEQYGGIVRNNLAGGLGIGLDENFLGATTLEVFGLGSKDTNRPDYPGPVLGYGIYTKLIVSPDRQWQFFGISWFGQDYMAEEGDGNYNSLGTDGVYYESSRTYEELGVRRFVEIENGVTFDFELRSHWVDASWANSFRIMAFVPFDVTIDRRNQNPAEQ